MSAYFHSKRTYSSCSDTSTTRASGTLIHLNTLALGRLISGNDDSLRHSNGIRDTRFTDSRHNDSQRGGDGVRCDTEEASQHSRSVHLLTSRGRRTGWSGCDVSHDCEHNIRAVAARASALHAVGVHRRRVLYCQHDAPRFVRLRPIPNHLPADKLQTGPRS